MKKFLILILSLLIAEPAFAMLQPKDAQVTVTTAATRVQISSTSTKFYDLTVCGNSGNTGIITVGSVTVVGAAATRQGVEIAKGSCFTFTGNSPDMNNGNLTDYYIDAATSGDKADVFYRVQK